jgi:two-component system, LuxR family, sensor kinase FixL
MELAISTSRQFAEARVEQFHRAMGPFVVAVETTRMPMIFTDSLDTDNPVVFANNAALALTGYDQTGILGRPLGDLLDGMADPSKAASLRSAMKAGGAGCWEMECRRADHSTFRAQVLLRPVRDESQVVRQNFLSFIEHGGPGYPLVSQLGESYAVYENAPGFVAVLQGPDHRFRFANAAYKRFFGTDNLVGQTVAQALPVTLDPPFLTALDRVYLTGETFAGKSVRMTVANRLSGLPETRYADLIYEAVRSADNDITGLFCEGYDVTRQHDNATALSALQSAILYNTQINAMGTLATTLAHELNQPLTAIINYAAGIQRMINSSSGPLGDAAKGIEQASQHAAEIIRNLREISRLREPVRTLFDMKTAVEECIELVRATTSPDIAMTASIAADVVMSADRIQIQQIVINLLRNACDAVLMAQHRTITMSVQHHGSDLVVCVADSGPGVSAEAAHDLFAWSNSVKDGGKGLGLSICRAIIEAHGGHIWLEDSSASGSEFCFSVPCSLSDASTPRLA